MARQRKRSSIFVTGEAGAGKTTLVDAFLEQANVEHYGSGQTYLPVLDAIGGLARGRRADRVIDVPIEHEAIAALPSRL